MPSSDMKILQGSPLPLGSCASKHGVNFAFSANIPKATLLIFRTKEEKPFLSIPLDPSLNKTGSTWHVFVYNLFPPFEYSIEVISSKNGKSETFHLLDPYAKGLSSPNAWGEERNQTLKARCFIPDEFDWQGTTKIKRPFKDWIIYEMHVRGFTQHSSSKTKKRGSFLGIIDKIPYLLSLGINAIELLPVFEFNECENIRNNPSSGAPLYNFWGYSTINFFSLMQRYASSDSDQAPLLEFKTLVRELHKNGISVILDVVYNHTAEGGEDGPTFSFKELDKNAYYLLNPQKEYFNFSGTGNTVNCNHPITTKLIVDSLSYFAEELQIDGFRFDLASIFTRGLDGHVLENPPLLEAMKQAPCLQETYFIAEAWDAAGLYQVGSFPGKERWFEWNGRYRDIVRNFIKGTDNQASSFAQALCGSQNIYGKYTPARSINFITAHDGYSLYDLVSYQDKHNLENGENNADGANDNESWNCGAEGETKDPQILSLRKRQMKNFLVALMVSLGTPMVLMGDEYGHTKKGNNNTYCQDTELSWFLWNILEKNKDFTRFFENITHLRQEKNSTFCRESFLTDKDVTWHGKEPFKADWSSSSRFVAYVIKDPITEKECFVAFNAEHNPVSIKIPSCSQKKQWKRIIDTSLDAPNDFIEKKEKRPVLVTSYQMAPHSAILAESY